MEVKEEEVVEEEEEEEEVVPAVYARASAVHSFHAQLQTVSCLIVAREDPVRLPPACRPLLYLRRTVQAALITRDQPSILRHMPRVLPPPLLKVVSLLACEAVEEVFDLGGGGRGVGGGGGGCLRWRWPRACTSMWRFVSPWRAYRQRQPQRARIERERE